MSASREKKKRQELLANGAVDPKAARAAEQKAAERKSNILYGTVAAIFVIVAVALFVYNSGIIQRNQTAVTIDGDKYNVAETSYYYQLAYNSYINSQEGYMAVIFGMLDTSAPLSSQSYDDTRTWADYFKETAVNNMKFVHATAKAASEANITLDSDDQALIKANVDSMKSAAATSGYSGYGAYLKAVFGSTMTSSIYESCLRDQTLANKYVQRYSEENFVYSDDDILAYYNEHKDTYDLIDGAYVTVSGMPEVKTDDEGNTIEATEEEKTLAMSTAKLIANEILASFEGGQNLEQLASAKEASYSTVISSASTVYGQWFYDASRKGGDSAVLEDTTSSCYYVVLFNSREQDKALDYSVRHILVTADNLDLPDGEEATNEQIEAKAKEILDSWDGTEEGFAELAKTHSQDGNAADGGIYENVPKGQMVAAFQDWCYEDGRQPGNTGIVQTTYGYHVMYFVGYGSTEYWHYACENALRSEAQTAWQTSLIEASNAEINESGMKNVG